MAATVNALWDRYRRYLRRVPETGVSLDISRVRFPDDYFDRMAVPARAALDAMAALEAGSIANPGENRMVGHFWLRAPELAPAPEISAAIRQTIEQVDSFSRRIHNGDLAGLQHLIHIGIGGSATGPQLLCEALRTTGDPVSIHFLDNSDPDAIQLLVEQLDQALPRTLVSVVSKCGYTPTPRYVYLEVEKIFRSRRMSFSQHAVATTIPGSDLDRRAVSEHWLADFLFWDWVGGRMSVTSAVGLLPAALQGVNIHAFLAGAAAMDRATRNPNPVQNPAAMLALMWHWLGNGRGEKNMVVLPYRDRLQMLPRYIQQLVMESIGKRLDRNGQLVEQGLTVYGNKGSTDQHAYLQQLRAGRLDFFTLFVRVQQDRPQPASEIADGVSLGDYLFGSSEGTRDALYERGRDSITITLDDVSPRSMGALIALLERTIGLYAELIDVNAYDQPGVDKHVADATVTLQQAVIRHLRAVDTPQTATQIANAIDKPEHVETVYKLLERLASAVPSAAPFEESFQLSSSRLEERTR